jgi:hypothetical protein
MRVFSQNSDSCRAIEMLVRLDGFLLGNRKAYRCVELARAAAAACAADNTAVAIPAIVLVLDGGSLSG